MLDLTGPGLKKRPTAPLATPSTILPTFHAHCLTSPDVVQFQSQVRDISFSTSKRSYYPCRVVVFYQIMAFCLKKTPGIIFTEITIPHPKLVCKDLPNNSGLRTAF